MARRQRCVACGRLVEVTVRAADGRYFGKVVCLACDHDGRQAAKVPS